MIDNIENNIDYNLKSDSNLIFIDSQIADYQGLIPNLEQAEVVMVEPDVNGIEEITKALASRQEVSNIHIISHGDVGYLQLGNSSLNANNLVNYNDELEQWSESLSKDANILLYGCNVTANDMGVQFIHQLSDITGADIAASDDLTGNSVLGGDWQLETTTGEIESSLPLSEAVIIDYNHVFAVSEDNLVMNLPFNDSGTTAQDISPNGLDNSGVLVNGASFREEGEPFEGVVDFDGVDDHVAIANSNDINISNNAKRTVSVWFQANDVGIDSRKQVIYEEGGSERGLNIYLDNGQLYVGGWNSPESNWSGTYLSTDTISSNTWHHVALVLDATPDATSVQSGAFTAYLDGVEYGSGEGSQVWNHPGGIGFGALNNGTRFHDGNVGGTATQGLDGSVDEAKLYNRALTATEIRELAAPGNLNPEPTTSSPVMELKLDETSGTQAADTSTTGQDNNGTLTNGAFFGDVGGDLGGGVTFDGDNDYVAIDNSDDINLQIQPKRTVSVWFKADDVSIDSRKQLIYEEGGSERGLNIYLENGQLYVGGWNKPASESNWTGSYLSTEEVSSDTWHHVALVLDAEPGATSVQEGAFTAYLDGTEFGSGVGSQLWIHPNGIALGALNGNSQFHDGVIAGTGTQALAGTIADAKLYNTALSADEINTLASLATPNAGAISLSTNKFKVNETDNSIDISVVRTGGSDGTATVDYRTFDIDAVSGEDYEGVAGTFTFASGETSKSVSIPILEDSVIEDIEQFSFTIDNVAGATLLAPRTAVIDIVDLEGTIPPTFSFSDFSDTSNLTLNGSATQFNNKLRLTPPENNLAGSAFYNQLIGIEADTSFQTNFQFQLSEGNNSNGADGFTFMVHNVDSGLNTLGDPGAGLGYTSTGIESIAVEFDTFKNNFDPSNNNVSILQNGVADKDFSSATPSFDLNSGAVLNAWVDYDGASDLLSVFVSDTTEKPETALVTETIELQLRLGSEAFVGFTAATGGLNNAHEIISWDFTTTGEVLDSPVIPPGNEVDETVVSGLSAPTAIDWTPEGNKLFVAEKRGSVRLFENGQLQSGLLVDIQDRVNSNSDRGLIDIAVHPDFNNNPYLYLLYTYDPPEVFNYPDNEAAKADGNGNRAGRLTRVTLDASTNYTSLVPDSEMVLLGANGTWDNFNGFVNSTVNFDEPPAGILADGSNLQDFLAADSQSHSVGSVEFGLDGSLYVTNGDGTSYNQVDPRTVRVQDLNNLSGKVLRVDPITGKGLADNPFYDGNRDSNISKVYQSGLRNPFRMKIHPETGQVFVGDVGWFSWEEINSGAAGANFGWPFFEGGNGESLRTPQYQDLSEAEDFYNSNPQVTPPLLALNHQTTGINAIVMGDIYTGSTYPTEFQGDLFFNDLGQGIVRNISFDASGNVSSVEVFSTEAQIVVQIAQGPDGNLYYVDLNDGLVGRWNFG